jgi:hypothetical protein
MQNADGHDESMAAEHKKQGTIAAATSQILAPATWPEFESAELPLTTPIRVAANILGILALIAALIGWSGGNHVLLDVGMLYLFVFGFGSAAASLIPGTSIVSFSAQSVMLSLTLFVLLGFFTVEFEIWGFLNAIVVISILAAVLHIASLVLTVLNGRVGAEQGTVV